MNEDKFPDAADMWHETNCARDTSTAVELVAILAAMRSAAKRGCSAITKTEISLHVQRILEQKGYKVAHHSDQRDSSSSYTISWHR
jgi:hypothetical protein